VRPPGRTAGTRVARAQPVARRGVRGDPDRRRRAQARPPRPDADEQARARTGCGGARDVRPGADHRGAPASPERQARARAGGGTLRVSAAAAPMLALLGPTASGKTEASIAIAEAMGAEILCVDSMLVYRGMDVGTAKPTAQQRSRVRHHLLDLADP